jgi:hypothetical protein
MTGHNDEVPEVETQQVVRSITEQTTAQPLPIGSLNDLPIRPTLRPAVPAPTVLDDGSLENGENIRLRGETFLIGRSEGDLVIPSDRTMSGKHAEIRRVDERDQPAWLLVDLDTANGTFVRVTSACLYSDAVVSLGTGRCRLAHPSVDLPASNEVSMAMLAIATSQVACGQYLSRLALVHRGSGSSCVRTR